MTYRVADGVAWIYPPGYVLTAEQVEALGQDNIAGLIAGGAMVEEKEKAKK